MVYYILYYRLMMHGNSNIKKVHCSLVFPISAKVKNTFRSISAPLYACVAWCFLGTEAIYLFFYLYSLLTPGIRRIWCWPVWFYVQNLLQFTCLSETRSV